MNDLVLLLVVIFVIVLLARGKKTLPALGAALGRGVKEAREAVTNDSDDAGDPKDDDASAT